MWTSCPDRIDLGICQRGNVSPVVMILEIFDLHWDISDVLHSVYEELLSHCPVSLNRTGQLNLSTDVLGWIFLYCVMCIVECLLASWASTYNMPVAPTPQRVNQKCLQMLPSVPWGAVSPLFENHWFRKGGMALLLNGAGLALAVLCLDFVFIWGGCWWRMWGRQAIFVEFTQSSVLSMDMRGKTTDRMES